MWRDDLSREMIWVVSQATSQFLTGNTTNKDELLFYFGDIYTKHNRWANTKIISTASIIYHIFPPPTLEAPG